MPIPTLNLDDRRFDDLLAAAVRHVQQNCPQWTDFGPGEPGTVLLEAFAHLTETMIYRLNRLPDKAFCEFVRLLGVTQSAPAGATVMLQFRRPQPGPGVVTVPRGTRVAAQRTEAGSATVFVTVDHAEIVAGQQSVETLAVHCEIVEAELLGVASGAPGLELQVQRAPLLAATGDAADLVVAVAEPVGAAVDYPAREYAGATYRIWREVDNFADVAQDAHVYAVDRHAGRILFAPALNCADGTDVSVALAAVPAPGREVRAWYRTGGGPAGNVAAGVLTILKDPLPGVHLEVTNPVAAVGGRAAETLDNALLRAPVELHSLERAVTARDFELVAVRSTGAVNRANAYSKANVWAHAEPGTTEVVLVPEVPESAAAAGVTPDVLVAQQSATALQRVEQELARRKPLGTLCLIQWCRYKKVKARVKVRVRREEDTEAVRARIFRRLHDTINPLSRLPELAGWPFGQALSSYHIYRILGAEPGVEDVEPVTLSVEHVPQQNVTALNSDAYQRSTWFAAAGDSIYRSLNDTLGWERLAEFPGWRVSTVHPYTPQSGTGRHPGWVAAVVRLPGTASRIVVSTDCGETWQFEFALEFVVNELAWFERDDKPALLLATDVGLYSLALAESAVPIQIVVNPAEQNLGFYCIAVSADVFGGVSVAVAARGRGGIYLSADGARPGTFAHIGMSGELVRLLCVQHDGPHRYLWAGLQAVGDDPGEGAALWELRAGSASPAGWRRLAESWAGGGCQDLAFAGSLVYAASSRLGVLQLDLGQDAPQWVASGVDCGLPLRDFGEPGATTFVMERVDCVAVSTGADTAPVLATGGAQGVYVSTDGGRSYVDGSRSEFSDLVSLPFNWLFCSGEHEVEVVQQQGGGNDATRSD